MFYGVNEFLTLYINGNNHFRLKIGPKNKGFHGLHSPVVFVQPDS